MLQGRVLGVPAVGVREGAAGPDAAAGVQAADRTAAPAAKAGWRGSPAPHPADPGTAAKPTFQSASWDSSRA